MSIQLKRFFLVFLSSSAASFASFLLVQYIQGDISSLVVTLGKSFIVGFGLAMLFAIPRQSRKDYPLL